MPNLRVGNSLRFGSIAVAAFTLMACGGGDVDEADPAQANGAVADGPAVRATALSSSSLPAGNLQLVTTTTGGAAASTSSTTCGLSANGRLVLFSSDAFSFVAGDTNGRTDIFQKNLDTGSVQRVRTLSNGAQIAAGGACAGSTPDGRYVAFNSGGAVFVKNTQTGQLTQASPPAGTVPQVVGYFGGSLSDDGRSVAFVTQPEQVYVGGYDHVNVAQGEVIGLGASLSPDGSTVIFGSNARNLVSPRPPTGVFQVYAKTIATAGAN